MSKYRVIAVEFQSETALVQALEDFVEKFGGSYERHETPTYLVGYLGDTRPEKAEYIIRRRYLSSGANDIGFARQADGTFRAIVSDFDAGNGNYSDREESEKFAFIKQRYAYHQTLASAEIQGYTVYEEELEDGSIVLTLERGW